MNDVLSAVLQKLLENSVVGFIFVLVVILMYKLNLDAHNLIREIVSKLRNKDDE